MLKLDINITTDRKKMEKTYELLKNILESSWEKGHVKRESVWYSVKIKDRILRFEIHWVTREPENNIEITKENHSKTEYCIDICAFPFFKRVRLKRLLVKIVLDMEKKEQQEKTKRIEKVLISLGENNE